MKKIIKLSTLLFFIFCTTTLLAQTWNTSGNTLSGGEKIGAINAVSLSIITNNEEQIVIKADGTVGIGTSATGQGFLLSVDGNVRARELVINSSTWADYVFAPMYDLMSLYDLDNYIKANKHLPGIPTTAEVKENGFSVSEMNVLLLEKVEELTLHTIQLNKRIDELEKRLQATEPTK